MNPTIYILNIIGMFIWILPPFRQYGTKFFIYFLMYAVSDLAGFVFSKYIYQSSNHIIFIAISAVVFFSIQQKENIKKYLPFYLSVLIISIIGILSTSNFLGTAFIIAGFHALIMITICIDFMKEYFNERMFNIFLLMIIFYELSTILKFASLLTGSGNAYIYFGLTTAANILTGLFFSFFRYDFNRYYLQLK